ncbi:unnamed protein product [Moneuplotes crassus]|uniref:Aminotransferase class I/classII large domain-containing protein n=2 Tax=Euplotes crassus TaxID=5936 RepID=A0AAD1UHY3_EUPCR|nr:unnamed protein product [Moneuplotes crassus]
MESEFKKQSKLDDNLCVWQEFGQISRKYKVPSLGEGAPHFQPPKFLVDNLVKAIEEGHNQYTSSYGHPEARKLIAELYSPKFNREINDGNEVLICNGANGCMNTLLQAMLSDEKDEVIFIEPFFPQYLGHAQFARGSIRTVPLLVGDDNQWHLDLDVLKETLNENTRCIILNTPHNPTGKVFTKAELQEISDILEEYPHVYVISDDVYDFLTFEGHEHHIFATLGDNWKKTITIFSGGKVLCCTGWKVGWAIGPADILRQTVVFNDCCTYCHNVPGQVAVARSLKAAREEEYEGAKSFVDFEKADFEKSHEILIKGLEESPLPIKSIPASGGYFIFADISELRDMIPEKYFEQQEYEEDPDTTIEKNDFGLPVPLDLAVCRWLAMEKKVVTMPGTFFYMKGSKHMTDKYIRLAFCRGEEITTAAMTNLK